MPGYEALLLRRTFPELDKTHLRRMAREAASVGAKFLESKRQIVWPNGSLVEAGHCDNDNDVGKYLSSEYDEICFDESSTFEPGVILEISSRARSSNPAVLERGGAYVRMGSNPGGVGELFLKDFCSDRAPNEEDFPKYAADDYAFIPAKIADNPYLDPDYTTRLEQLPEARQRQLRDGDWDVFEAQMFGAFRQEKDGAPWHVEDLDSQVRDETPAYGGVDWGYNQPGCFLWARAIGDGRLYIQDELKFSQTSVERVALAVQSRTIDLGIPRFRAVYCDPSMGNKTGFGKPGEVEAESHADVFARFGVPMLRSDNDRFHGWQRLHDYLRPAPDGRPWLVISPRCRYLIRTLPALQQDDKNPEDVDTTMDDHAADALRYLLVGRPLPGQHPGRKTRPKPGTVGWLKMQDERPTPAPLRTRRYA
jgi:hypothetical protein